mmetsp:Transcript_126134/g.403687  ORF Transcript_126134/g.403687 Transcript_126134/m.403687 type:complete len:473 (+) Transcript_126134:765-2183(+)
MASDQTGHAQPLLPRSKSWVARGSEGLWPWPGRQHKIIEDSNGGSPVWRSQQSSRDDFAELDARWWMLFPVLAPQFGGLALTLPALTNYKLHFFGGDAALAARVQSLAESSRAFLTFLVSSELGRISDAVGRRPLLLLSVACTLAPLLSLALTSNLWPYFALFVLAGLMGGQNSPAVSAYVADCCSKESRTRNFGIIGSVGSFVFMLLPACGGFISKAYGQQELFKVAAGLELVAACAAAFLPESLPANQRRAYRSSLDRTKILEPLRALIQNQGGALPKLAAVRFFRNLSANGTLTVISFFLASLGHFSDADFGELFAVVGLGGIIGQVFVLQLFLRLGCSEHVMLLVAISFGMLQMIGFLIISSYPWKSVIFANVMMDAVTSIGNPAFSALVVKERSTDVGLMLGVFASVDGLTSFIAPLLFSSLFSVDPRLPFAVALASNAISFVVLATVWLKHPSEVEAPEADANFGS